MSDGVVSPGPRPLAAAEKFNKAASAAVRSAALSVWPTGQHDEIGQLRDGGYVADTAADAEGVVPAIAVYAITTYSQPGEVVLDPDCGAGTVLVEALRAGRHAVGLTPNARWWNTARANVTAAKRHGAWRDGSVLDGKPQLLATVRAAGLAGRVGLVLTTLRLHGGCDLGGGDPDNALTRLTRTLRHCRPLVRPGGHVIVILRPRRHAGALLDLPSPVLAAGQTAGLIPAARCVALLAELRDSRLVTCASLAQRRAAARDRAAGAPTLLPVHHDVLVFRVPALAEPVALAAARGHLPPMLSTPVRRPAAEAHHGCRGRAA
ncbi:MULTISPECIES: site-specific DNA-methyltransferase [unclassified Crossiella]|uniref:site-specific DNA-methyltransferase n=1 Tax=unclassified Crossiella TaxID=2620835 RepID=UPI001FFE6F2E|nr:MULTISPECIES: site-specific DNA-methyltransferase [unclassified Crossiella]MCK2239784.1 site-specific DNA-methyltransferase [Crossiella sp. S99.2]MCK2252479.1 site-specific DNA-methyltransferase [Crossiella sp. S99.1]